MLLNAWWTPQSIFSLSSGYWFCMGFIHVFWFADNSHGQDHPLSLYISLEASPCLWTSLKQKKIWKVILKCKKVISQQSEESKCRSWCWSRDEDPPESSFLLSTITHIRQSSSVVALTKNKHEPSCDTEMKNQRKKSILLLHEELQRWESFQQRSWSPWFSRTGHHYCNGYHSSLPRNLLPHVLSPQRYAHHLSPSLSSQSPPLPLPVSSRTFPISQIIPKEEETTDNLLQVGQGYDPCAARKRKTDSNKGRLMSIRQRSTIYSCPWIANTGVTAVLRGR